MNDKKEEESQKIQSESPEKEKRNEERLKQIQNITKINVEELDSYLQLHFIQKHGNDIDKIGASLVEYQGIIQDSIARNHKRGYMIWINLKGLLYTLIYLLSKIQYTFQIDIFERIIEIKNLLFNQFWASEIQELEEYQILKLCLVILVFQRQASSINDIIFEYDNYKVMLQEIFETNVLQKKQYYSCLYLYKIFSAVAFSMQYKKYDIKSRERIFDVGYRVFQQIWANKINEQYIMQKNEELKCIHCYFEFISKYFKLLLTLEGKSQKALELMSNCLRLLEGFSTKLNKQYFQKVQLRLQKSHEEIQKKMKEETLRNGYFIENLNESQQKERHSQANISIDTQQQNTNDKEHQNQQQNTKEGSEPQKDKQFSEEKSKKFKLTNESVQSYIKQFMLNKFSKQPQNEQPQQVNESAQTSYFGRRKIISSNEQLNNKPYGSGSKLNLQSQGSISQLGSGCIQSVNKLKSQDNLANMTFMTGDLGKKVLNSQLQQEIATKEDIESKQQLQLASSTAAQLQGSTSNITSISYSYIMEQIQDFKRSKKTSIHQDGKNSVQHSNSRVERLRAESGANESIKGHSIMVESMKTSGNALEQQQKSSFAPSPSSQGQKNNQQLKRIQSTVQRIFESNAQQMIQYPQHNKIQKQTSITYKHQFLSKQHSVGSLLVDEMQQNKSQDIQTNQKQIENLGINKNLHPFYQQFEQGEGLISLQEQGEEEPKLENYNNNIAFTFGQLQINKNLLTSNQNIEDPTPKMVSMQQQSLQNIERKIEIFGENEKIVSNKSQRRLKSASLNRNTSDQSFQKISINRLNENILNKTLSSKAKQFIPSGIIMNRNLKKKYANIDDTYSLPTTTMGTTQVTIPNQQDDKSVSIYSQSTDVAKIYRTAATSFHSASTQQNIFKGKNRNGSTHAKSKSIHYAFGSTSTMSNTTNGDNISGVGVLYVPNKSFQYNYLLQPQFKGAPQMRKPGSMSFHQTPQSRNFQNSLVISSQAKPSENASAVFLYAEKDKITAEQQQSSYQNNQEQPKELSKAQQLLMKSIKQTQELVQKQKEEMKKMNQKIISNNNYTLEMSDDSYFNLQMPSVSNIPHQMNSDSNRIEDFSLSQIKQNSQTNKMDQDQINLQNAPSNISNPLQHFSSILSNPQIESNNISLASLQSLPFPQFEQSQQLINFNPHSSQLQMIFPRDLQSSTILSPQDQPLPLFRRVSSTLEKQIEGSDKNIQSGQEMQTVEEQAEEIKSNIPSTQKIREIQKLDSIFARQYSSKRLMRMKENLQTNLNKEEKQEKECEEGNQGDGQFLIKDFFNDSSKLLPKTILDSQNYISPQILLQHRTTEVKFIESPAISQVESNETKPSIIVRNMEGDVIEKHSNLVVVQNAAEGNLIQQKLYQRQHSQKDSEKEAFLHHRLNTFQKYLRQQTDVTSSKSMSQIKNDSEQPTLFQQLNSQRIASLEHIDRIDYSPQPQKSILKEHKQKPVIAPNIQLNTDHQILRKKEPIIFSALQEEQFLEDQQTPQTLNNHSNNNVNFSSQGNIPNLPSKRFTFFAEEREQVNDKSIDKRIQEETLSPILPKPSFRINEQISNFDDNINPLQSTSIINQQQDDSRQKTTPRVIFEEMAPSTNQEKNIGQQFFHSKSLDTRIDLKSWKPSSSESKNEDEGLQFQKEQIPEIQSNKYTPPIQVRRVFSRNNLRHQSQQSPISQQNHYNEASISSHTSSYYHQFKNKKRTSFQLFLQEEQQKQIQQFNIQDNEVNQHTQLENQSQEFTQDSILRHQLQRKVTIASSNSEQMAIPGIVDNGKLKIPLSQVDYDFDKYSEIYREVSPISTTKQEFFPNTTGGEVYTNKNINNTHHSHTITNVHQLEDQTSFNQGLNTIIEQPSQLGLGSGRHPNKTLMNFDIETVENMSKQKSLSQTQVSTSLHPQHFSDAITHYTSHLQQQMVLTSPALTSDKYSNSTTSQQNYNIYNTNGNINNTNSTVITRLQAQTISSIGGPGNNSKPGNTGKARRDDSIRRLSIQSNQMLSQQQISLSSFNDIIKKEQSLKGKPHLQNLLGQLQLDIRNQEILHQITSQKKLTIKSILAIKDLKDVEIPKIPQIQEIQKQRLYRSKRSYSNISAVGREVEEEDDQMNNEYQKIQPVTTNNRQVMQRQRSFFYKQKQEQLVKKQGHNQENSILQSVNNSSDTNQNESQTSIIRGNLKGRAHSSSSSSDESKQSISSQSKRLQQVKDQTSYDQIQSKENPNIKNIINFKERTKKKKSSRFLQYKQDANMEIIENQPNVSKNIELVEHISISSDKSGSNTPDFTTKNKRQKKSTFSEALQMSYQNDKPDKKDEAMNNFSSDKSPTTDSRYLDQEEIDEIEKRDFIENIKIEENEQDNHQIGLFNRQAENKIKSDLNQTRIQKYKKKNSNEEDSQQPFLPTFKFVRFVSGMPMVITVMYQMINVPREKSTIKDDLMNIKNDKDSNLNREEKGLSDFDKQSITKEQDNLSKSNTMQDKSFLKEEKLVNRIIIKFNDMQLFAKKESQDKFIAQIDLEIDQEAKFKFQELQKMKSKKKESQTMIGSNVNMNDEEEYKTIWPLFNSAFEQYLRKHLPKVYTIPDPHSDDEEDDQKNKKSLSISKFYQKQNRKNIKDIISDYNMFVERPENIEELVSELDLRNIGSIKDKINQLIKHYGKRVRKEMGYSFYISDEDQTNSLVLVSLRKQIDKSSRIYSNIVPFYTWDLSKIEYMKNYLYQIPSREKQVKVSTSCLKEPSYRKTENYIIQRHVKYLSQRLAKIIQSPPIILTFFKKDDTSKIFQITVKISFKPGSENIKSSTFTNFSFYILGKNMRTLRNTIQPLDIHVEEIIDNDPSFQYIYKIVSKINYQTVQKYQNLWLSKQIKFLKIPFRFAIYDRIPRKWTEFLIKYFERILVFRSSDKQLRQNYDYKLESIYQILKKKQQFDREYRFIDQIEKRSMINNLILRNIIFKETISRENFHTIFDEKFNESYAQYSSQMRLNIQDIEEMLQDDAKDLKEAEIEFIKQISKNNTDREKQGPKAENVTEQDLIDNSAESIINNQKLLDEKKKEMEMIVRRITEQFKKTQRMDIFCNKSCSRVIIMNYKQGGCKYWVYLQTYRHDLVLFVKNQQNNEKYKLKIKNWKQKELILNIFKTRQTQPSTCYISQNKINYYAYQKVQMQVQANSQHGSEFQYQVRNLQFLRNYLIKNFIQKQVTQQGFRLVPQKFNDNILRNNLNLDSLNTIKDHLLLNQRELLRHYIENTSYFVRSIKSLGKTSIILKAYRLGNDLKTKLDGQQCLFLFSIIPYESRTKIFKFVMNYLDVIKLNPEIANQILSNFNLKSISKLLDFVINQFSVLKTYIGTIPIFSFIEKEQIVGNERQVYFSIVKKDTIKQHKVQKLFPQLSAKDIFKKLYNISNSFKSSNSSFNNRRKSEQIKQGTMKVRYFQNKFYKNEYEFSKHSKNTAFLEDSSFQKRVIVQQPKLFGTDWGLVTIMKDVLALKWIIRIYIPKTSRTISCKLSNSDFERCSTEFIMQCITNQLMFFNENPKFQAFSDFNEFYSRMKARFYNIGSNLTTLQTVLKPLNKIQKNTSIPPAQPNNKLQMLIKKYKHKILEDSQPKFAETSKLNSIKKIFKINKFLDLTKKLDESFQMHLYDYRQLFLLKFVEIWIWQLMFQNCHFRINHQNLEIYLYFGSAKLSISELIFYDQYKISETNEFSTEIYIDLIKTYHNPTRLKLSKESEERKEFTNTRKALVDHYFNTMEYLPYESTSKFNFHLSNYSIRTQTTKTFDINLREILNLYIAEGFSKLHTGYTNSKVTYNDLREVCSFIIFKIKTQNFLDLALNENVNARAKQIIMEKKNQEKYSNTASRKSSIVSDPKSSVHHNNQGISIINNIINNPKNKNNFIINEKRKSIFAPDIKSSLKPQSPLNNQERSVNKRKSIIVRHRQSILDHSQRKVNFNVDKDIPQQQLPQSESSPSGLSGIKRVDSNLSKMSLNSRRSSVMGSFKSDSEYFFNVHTINQNSSDLDDSSIDLSEKPQIFIYDSVVDIKNRIMIRTYFYTSDATFVIKIFQCGTGFAFTRFLHYNYFAKKEGFFTQYLKAELYEEIIKRATKIIKPKMYVYFCIQHKINPNENIIL